MRNKIVAILLIGVMAVGLMGCQSGSGDQPKGSTETKAVKETQADSQSREESQTAAGPQTEKEQVESMKEENTMAAPEVAVTGGKIRGAVDENGIKYFKGIPYAASTEGENRFREPQPVEPWEGVKDCLKYGQIAMQNEASTYGGQAPWTDEYLDLGKTYESGDMSEDCLNLNVWTGASEGEKLPVIVYIHGGGNNSGSGACEVYTGEDIAQKGVVFVTLNYRVGMFGFLAYKDSTGEEVTGNFGIMDQIAALKWVQENIEKFGGDPDNVTIAGQSAGSGNCQTLLASPAASGLFNRAVCMSANSYKGGPSTLEQAQSKAAEMLGDYTLEDLRAMSSTQVQELTATYNPSSTCIDGKIVTQSLAEAFASGKYNTGDMLWGCVTEDRGLFSALRLPDDDGNPFTAVTTVTPENYKIAVKETFGKSGEDCLNLYPADDTAEDVMDIANEVNFDSMISGYYYAASEKNAGDNAHKTYIYNFSRVVPDTQERMDANGAFHTGDVGYWLNHFTTTYVRPWSDTDYELGNVMSDYLVNFAKTGDPNGMGSDQKQLPEWKDVASTENIAYLDLGDQIQWVEMDADKAEFWMGVNK